MIFINKLLLLLLLSALMRLARMRRSDARFDTSNEEISLQSFFFLSESAPRVHQGGMRATVLTHFWHATSKVTKIRANKNKNTI